jgi:hypothetical protein
MHRPFKTQIFYRHNITPTQIPTEELWEKWLREKGPDNGFSDICHHLLDTPKELAPPADKEACLRCPDGWKASRTLVGRVYVAKIFQ